MIITIMTELLCVEYQECSGREEVRINVCGATVIVPASLPVAASSGHVGSLPGWSSVAAAAARGPPWDSSPRLCLRS